MATGTSSKGGHDCEFITAPPKSLECPICLLTVRRPHVISCCGNQFCQPCIGRIQNDNKPCPLCNDGNFTTLLHKGVMREVNSLMVRCSNKEMGCDWEGELGQLEEHLNPGASVAQGKGCGYVMVECHHKCGGSFQRNVVQDHELHECPMRPMEVQVNTLSFRLAKKLDDICSKLDSVMAENEHLKRENQHRKAEIEKIKAENQNQKAEMETLKTENQVLRAECDATKKSVNTVQSACTSLQACVQPLPPFNFTMYNVQLCVNFDCMSQSQPFYSHKEGYKLKVQVFPNGCSPGKVTHLSLRIAICRGEYDDKLKWPFSGKVIVQVFNRLTDRWVTKGIIDFEDAPLVYRAKPPSDCIASATWGYSKIISHAELKSTYLGNDMIRFRISRIEF